MVTNPHPIVVGEKNDRREESMAENNTEEVTSLRFELAKTNERLFELESLLDRKAERRRMLTKGLTIGMVPFVALMLLGGSFVAANGGMDALFVGPDGNVGIGTSSPATTLDVQGSASVSENFSVNENVNLATTPKSLVTIGPSNSLYETVLQVDGSAWVTQDFIIEKAGGDIGFRFTTANGVNYIESFNGPSGSAELVITKGSAGDDWMSFDTAGNATIHKSLNVESSVVTNGSLTANNLGFHAQKACSVVSPSHFRDTVLVPNSWSADDCDEFTQSGGETAYNLICIFETSFSIGDGNGGAPSPNCGW